MQGVFLFEINYYICISNNANTHTQIHTYMFVLRKISKDGKELNVSLGELYEYVSSKSDCISKYIELEEDNNISGLVLDFEGNEYFIRYDDKCYIVTDSGKTFKRL